MGLSDATADPAGTCSNGNLVETVAPTSAPGICPCRNVSCSNCAGGGAGRVAGGDGGAVDCCTGGTCGGTTATRQDMMTTR